MKKCAFFTLLLMQGIIHFFVFLKAYAFFPLVEINSNINKAEGLLWLAAAGLFLMGAAFYLHWKKMWPGAVLLGAILSQLLVNAHWDEARFLTGANVLLLVIVLGDIIRQRTKPARLYQAGTGEHFHALSRDIKVSKKTMHVQH